MAAINKRSAPEVLPSTYNVSIVAESAAGEIAVNTYRPGLFAHQWNDTCFNQSNALVVVLQFVIKSPT